MANLGPWTAPTIANHMFIKAIVSQLFLTTILLLMQWHIFTKAKLQETLSFSWPLLCFSAFFIWATLSIFWAVNPHFYIFKWMMLLCAAISFYICIRFDEKRWDIVFKGIVFSAFCTAILSLAQVYLGFNEVPQVSVPAATFGNKNMMGQLMVLASTLSLYYFVRSKDNSQYLYLAACACMLLALYHGQARATWLSQIIAYTIVFIFIYLNRSKLKDFIFWTKKKSYAALSALVFIAVLSNFNKDGYSSFVDTFSNRMGSIASQAQKIEGSNVTVRYMIWRACWNMIKEKPLMGSGLGGFFENMLSGYKNYKSMRTFRAHNDFIEFIVELGLIGFGLVASAILGLLYAYWRLIAILDKKQLFLLTSVSAAALGNMFNALFSFPYQLTLPLVTIACYFAYILSVAHQHQIFQQRKIAFNSIAKSGALIASIAVFSFVWYVNIDWWGGYKRINSAMKSGSKPFYTGTTFFNQEQVPIMWAVGTVLNKSKRYAPSVHLMTELYKRWPREYVTLELHYDAFMGLGRPAIALKIAEEGLSFANQGLFGFYQKLYNHYLRQGDRDKASGITQRLANLDSKYLSINSGGFDQLILMTMKLGEDPKPQYERMKQLLKTNSNTENNMAIYYLSLKDRENAVIHITNLLELAPYHANAKAFKDYKDNPKAILNVNI